MKKLLLVVTGLFMWTIGGSAQAILIVPGSTFEMNFDLSGQTPAPPYNALQIQLFFGPTDLFGLNEGFTLEAFDSSDNSVSSSFSTINPFSSSSSIGIGFPLSPFPNLFDGQGSILFTDIVGTFDLLPTPQVAGWDGQGFEVGVDITEYVSTDLSVTNPIPEPATVLLLGTGLFGLVGFRKKFKK
jgi:hypothetical protein